MKTFAVYPRTSREYKNVEKVSIAQQVTDAQAKAKELGGQIPEDLVFIDANISSTIPPRQYNPAARKVRPGITALLEAVASRKLDGVIVRKRNRLSRNLEMRRWIRNYLKDHNCPIIATNESDFGGDATGRFSEDQLALVDEFKLEQTREDVRAAKAFCKREGRKMCGVSLPGYVDGPERGQVLVHAADIEVMREAFQRIARGDNKASVCRWLNAEHRDMLGRIRNGRMFYLETLNRFLSNTRYIGIAPDGSPDKVFPATINPDLFHRVQQILKNRKIGKVRWKIQRHVLSGLIKCGCCNESMQVLSAKLKNKWQKVYACRRLNLKHAFWPVMIQEAEWIRFVETVFINPSGDAWGFLRVDRKPTDNPEKNSLQIQLAHLTDELDKAAKLAGAGKMSVDGFARLDTRLNETRIKLQNKLKSLPDSVNQVFKSWDKCNHDEKQDLLRSLIREIRAYNRHIDIHLPKCVLRFPLMRQAKPDRIGRSVNVLLPRTVGNADDILLVLDGQLTGEIIGHTDDGVPTTATNTTAVMDWRSWISRDFYPAPPVIAKRPGESKNDYRARWMRESGSGNRAE